jgi:methionyl-tRNA formyltransferase
MMLDFNKETAEQIHARIRAFHPWLPCYITYNGKFIIPNPYKIKIIDKISDKPIGSIIEKDVNTLSITVLCQNNKALKFDGVKLYGYFSNTKSFIKNIKI